MINWEMFYGRIKLGASAAASKFCEWVQVGIDVYIPHRKYQVQPHWSSWFSAAGVAAIVHKNHFFRLYQKDKSFDAKVKFRQASNRCKRVLEAAKLACDNETNRVHHFPETGSWDFWRIANSVLKKVNLLYHLYSTTRSCCLLRLMKQSCLLKTFLRTLILMIHASAYLFFLLELIWN